MKPEPLKGKRVCLMGDTYKSKETDGENFDFDDVKSAVEWLKNQIIFPQDMQHIKLARGIDWKFLNDKIDEAFEDVTKRDE